MNTKNKINNFQKRFLTFIIGCIGVRILIVLLIKNLNRNYLPYFGYIGLVIAGGFIYNYIFGKNLGSTFGQIAWWKNLRLIHAFFYLWFSYLAFYKSSFSYIPLLIDVSFGLTSFIAHHLSCNSFINL